MLNVIKCNWHDKLSSKVAPVTIINIKSQCFSQGSAHRIVLLYSAGSEGLSHLPRNT